MAGRFIKIRRVVIPFLSLVILASQLAGCAALSSTELMEEINSGQSDVIIEYNELDTSSKSNSSSSITLGDSAYGYEFQSDDDPSIGLMNDDESVPELVDLTEAELLEWFNNVYTVCSANPVYDDLEENIQFELQTLADLCKMANKKLPSDYEARYRAWRPVEEEVKSEAATQQENKTGQNTQANNNGNSGQQNGGSTSSSSSTGSTQVIQPPSSSTSKYVDENGRPVDERGYTLDIYDGYNSYE